MSIENFGFLPQETKPEQERNQLSISPVNPELKKEIADYYQFEIDQGFTELNSETTFDKMVSFRQRQLREGKLKVLIAREGDKIVGTSVVVLENGTMGKTINEDEAWAAGTVVDKTKQGLGIGEKIAREQDGLALAAGKKYLRTTITNNNLPSMRLRMKVGYELEGVDKRKDHTNYLYRKTLGQEQLPNHWREAIQNQAVFKGEINETTPKVIFIDPADEQTIQLAINNNYRGVYLLTPRDSAEANNVIGNLIVFVKKQ